MAGSIRGDGVWAVDNALAVLTAHPERLDRARRRFSKSPPSYAPSESSTRLEPSNPPSPGEIERGNQMKRQRELNQKLNRSAPGQQFRQQRFAQRKLINDAYDNTRDVLPYRVPIESIETTIVKDRWKDQGIWNDKWDEPPRYDPLWRWKHEESLESESPEDSEAAERAAQMSALFGDNVDKPKEAMMTADRRATLQREREASRPIAQFLWQMSKERDVLQGMISAEGSTLPAPLDINTTAYEIVKNRWIEFEIWDTRWGIMPGMSWVHERIPEYAPPAKDKPDANHWNPVALEEISRVAWKIKAAQPPLHPELYLVKAGYHNPFSIFGNALPDPSAEDGTAAPNETSVSEVPLIPEPPEGNQGRKRHGAERTGRDGVWPGSASRSQDSVAPKKDPSQDKSVQVAAVGQPQSKRKRSLEPAGVSGEKTHVAKQARTSKRARTSAQDAAEGGVDQIEPRVESEPSTRRRSGRLRQATVDHDHSNTSLDHEMPPGNIKTSRQPRTQATNTEKEKLEVSFTNGVAKKRGRPKKNAQEAGSRTSKPACEAQAVVKQQRRSTRQGKK
ncbi:MAG: hypothetical protein Q9223_005126 [Gallowayella weberi]